MQFANQTLCAPVPATGLPATPNRQPRRLPARQSPCPRPPWATGWSFLSSFPRPLSAPRARVYQASARRRGHWPWRPASRLRRLAGRARWRAGRPRRGCFGQRPGGRPLAGLRARSGGWRRRAGWCARPPAAARNRRQMIAPARFCGRFQAAKPRGAVGVPACRSCP